MASVNKKKTCKYGETCYRKNSDHLKNYDHSNVKLDEEEEKPSKKLKTSDNLLKEVNENKIECVETIVKECGVVEKRADEIKANNEDHQEKFDLKSIKDLKEFVNEQIEMKMPDDFWELIEFCKSIDPKDPKNALKSIDIQLAGAFDLAIDGLKLNYKIHSRHFYDPPEFQTVLECVSSETKRHFGYFRDDPNELPDFVAMNEPKCDCIIHPKGENLFSVINWQIDSMLSEKPKNVDEIKQLRKDLETWCKKSKTLTLELRTAKMKAREKKINCKTFHQAGIYVHVDANGVGYRDVPETNESQKKLFRNCCNSDESAKAVKAKADERVQEIITLIQFANDENDYGMGLEFFQNMFSFGEISLHKYIKSMLPTCYSLLGRDLYAEILKEHLKIRKSQLSEK